MKGSMKLGWLNEGRTVEPTSFVFFNQASIILVSRHGRLRQAETTLPSYRKVIMQVYGSMVGIVYLSFAFDIFHNWRSLRPDD
jgi:hypothetical protein